MNVLLIRSDLPESPEVLLLAGVLRARNDLRWIPSPEVIVCKLIKIWAWVAEHGSQDSDSCDYRIPTPLVAALEDQLDCRGLVDAMCDDRVDWCRQDSAHVAFCRFAEWNGVDAMKRRGDSARARRSRTRSRTRMSREPGVTSVTKLRSKSPPKAHASRDDRHGQRAPSIDVDEDVFLETNRETSTSSSNNASESVYDCQRRVELAYERIRREAKSAIDADDAQVAMDRQTAWKIAVAVEDHIDLAWLDRLLETVTRTKPRRPYGYLFGAIRKKLDEQSLDASKLFALIHPPSDLTDPDDQPRLEKPKPKPQEFSKLRDRHRVEIVKSWKARGKFEFSDAEVEEEIDRRLNMVAS